MTVDVAIPKLDLDPYSPEFLADHTPATRSFAMRGRWSG